MSTSVKITKKSIIFGVFTLVIFVSMFIRITPWFGRYGRDFFSTVDSFPYEIANGYGAYNILGLICGYYSLEFVYFWLTVSLVLSLAFFCFAFKFTYIYSLSYLLLTVFIFGIIVPWFCYQNFRYGASLLFLVASLNVSKSISRIIFVVISGLIHPLSVIWFVMYFFISKLNLRTTIAFMLFALVFTFLWGNTLFIYVMKISTYGNYINDFLEHGENWGNTKLSFLRCALFFIVTFVAYRGFEFQIMFSSLVVYAFSIYYTPFHGRVLPLIYMMFVYYALRNINVKKRGLSILLFIMLIDSVKNIHNCIYNE
jgi:hypothetical protein